MYHLLHQRTHKLRYITSLVSNSCPYNRFCHMYAVQSHTRAPPQIFLFVAAQISAIRATHTYLCPYLTTISSFLTRALASCNDYVLTSPSTCRNLKTSAVRWLNASDCNRTRYVHLLMSGIVPHRRLPPLLAARVSVYSKESS